MAYDIPPPDQRPEPGYYYHFKHDPAGPLNNYAYFIYGVGHHTEDDCRTEGANGGLDVRRTRLTTHNGANQCVCVFPSRPRRGRRGRRWREVRGGEGGGGEGEGGM